MNYKLMAERTRYLKENPKGVSEMCRIMEDMRNESLKEGIKKGSKPIEDRAENMTMPY